MNYHPADQLRIVGKVLSRLPVAGAANVRVMDLIYGSDPEQYRYVFSVEYTLGVTGLKRRAVRVASLTEPRGRAAADVGALTLTLAPSEGRLIDQYCSFAPAAPA
jgi:hypothetical protein